MDLTLFQKFKDNFAALVVGMVIAATATWQVASTLNKREVEILERQLAEAQKRIEESDSQLKLAQQAISKAEGRGNFPSASERKAELEALIKRLDREIAAKMTELAAASPISFDGPKGELYLEIEKDIASLKGQRNEARLRLINAVGDVR